MRRDSPQASRSCHHRAGTPILSPLIPGCSVAGDQAPSRSASGEAASRRLNPRVHERVALDEIELYAEVLSAAAAADRPLTAAELDEALGISEGPGATDPKREEKSPSSPAPRPRHQTIRSGRDATKAAERQREGGPSQDVEIGVTQRGQEYAIVTVAGEINMDNVTSLREHLFDELAVSRHLLIVDLDQVSFIDAAGLAMLASAARRAAARGARPHVICARPSIRQLFHRIGLDSQIPLAHTLDEALESAAARGTPAGGPQERLGRH